MPARKKAATRQPEPAQPELGFKQGRGRLRERRLALSAGARSANLRLVNSFDDVDGKISYAFETLTGKSEVTKLPSLPLAEAWLDGYIRGRRGNGA